MFINGKSVLMVLASNNKVLSGPGDLLKSNKNQYQLTLALNAIFKDFCYYLEIFLILSVISRVVRTR